MTAPAGRRASFAQERMWFLESLDPGSAIYNQPNAFRIRGPVDARLLERSLGEVIARHEALRTNMYVADGQIYQRVLSQVPPGFQSVDLPGGSLDDARRLLVEAARKPFDLAVEPLVRPYLIRLEPDDFLLGLITHHSIMDGWSIRILVMELATIYDDLLNGRPPGGSLPGPGIRYTDYADRQRQRFDAGDYDRQMSHWQQALDGDLPVLALPADHRRPASQPYEGRAYTATLPPAMTAALKALGRKEKATLFMVLLAAYDVLLYRYTGQDDLVVGCPVAGRNELDVEGTIGLFVNTLPLRCSISPSDSFLALLRQVKATALAAYDNQDLPFEKLVEQLVVPRMMDRSPVFQTLFQLRNFTGQAARIAGRPMERVGFDEVVARADMTLEITETDDGLMCRFEYPVALFEAATVARMAGCWQTLLEDVLADPSEAVSRLRILTDREQGDLLALGRGPRKDYPRDETVDGIFEKRARASPDSVAIIDGTERLTYRELDARASRLAGKLRLLGVRAGEPVALLAERSAALVTAMLAVLKAGGAYVPIDTGDADSRIAGILADAAVRVVLAGPGLAVRAKGWAPHVLDIDEAIRNDGQPGIPPLGSGNGPDSLAYIMFTSGSTGVPKGVRIPHRGILRLVTNTDYVTIRPGDAISHLSDPAFDAATFEVWGALLNGTTLAVIDRATALSPPELEARIEEYGIDVLFMPTSLFGVIAMERPGCFRRIRDLLVGGDVLEPGPAKAVLKNGLRGRLLNAYGPTENTTFSTWHHVSEVADTSVSIPIGRPIANDYLCILDEARQLVPAGVIGEIYLGGDGVAAGYLNRPDLTAARFLPDPFDGRGRRIYKTGDLARFLPEGNVQFLGRRDGQAKIHGFRVETGEVIRALETHPAVRSAIVTIFTDPGGFKSLAAYLLKSGEAPVAIADIRRYLAGRLPAYMVPASMAWIDAVPLTSRGKIDRGALPDPARGMAQAKTSSAPGGDGDPALSRMTAAWESVLGAGGVGPDDNFFDLGGHSLLAIRLIDRVGASFEVKLPVSAIFTSPSPRQMLAALRETCKGKAGNVLVPLQTEGVRPPLYCIHGVPGTLFEFDALVRQIGKDQPVYGIQSPGLDDVTRMPDTIEAMAALYVDIIRGRQRHGPYHFLSYCAGGSFAYEVAHQLASAGEEIGFLGIIDYPAPKQEIRSFFWPCYRYACDNAGGAMAHLTHFWHAGAGEKAISLLALPAFLAKKALRLPVEVAAPAGEAALPTDALTAPYPEWLSNFANARQEVVRRNYDAIRRYHPAASPIKATIFMSSQRVLPGRRSGNYERTFGWKRLARRGVKSHVIRGDHGTIISPDNFTLIARIARASIDRSTRAGGGHGK